MAHFSGAGTINFGGAAPGAPQANQFWVPEIYSKKVQIALRKASVAEAICNTDYMGEIKSFGDTVNIVQEPQITVANYTRGATPTNTALTDNELVLIVDQAASFKFQLDDIEKRFSHINFQSVASDNAAYKLKDFMDANILTNIGANAGITTGMGTVAAPIDIGFVAPEVDPLNQMSLAAKEMDDNNVPEEGRWFVAAPEWYNQLANTASKLLSIDYNAGKGSLRNGLVASGLVRGFQMYKSNNMPTNAGGGLPAGNHPEAHFGQMSAVSCASSMKVVESLRATDTFADIVRGLLVWGRKVLRTDACGKIIYKID
jgi:hypothetical protein|tara:strand:+ start:273 stop:1217 length:945 start_codon:yes stop_codon:yes gene_type:complete